tara:strand:- start:29501 stop:29710 length:210 start_codon:yes stop_codon:yes gene_type:complete
MQIATNDRPVTLWGAKNIASYLNRSARQIYDAFERKTLPIGKVGGVLIARTDELDAFLRSVCRNQETVH